LTAKVRLERVAIPNCGLATTGRHGLPIRKDAKGDLSVKDSPIVDTQNSLPDFRITQE
jgi:hypothetical protein